MSATIQSAGCPAPAQDNKLLLWQRFIKGRGISYIVLAVIGIVWIFPFLWMALGSLKTQREILAKPPKLMPEHATLANFSQWFTQLNFGSYFTNSLIVAVITVLGNMVFCSMVGYALAKMKFAGKNILFGAVMVTLMVPSVATFVPLFVIISNMHLANTYAALILPFLCQPIGVPNASVHRWHSGRAHGSRSCGRCWRTTHLLPDHPAAMWPGAGHAVHPDLPV